uniref:J domain-containing protein n=1 Tax=Glossina palpalis gambiensis TaxID=67801 RepID=A0A1B0BDU2_9MUSC
MISFRFLNAISNKIIITNKLYKTVAIHCNIRELAEDLEGMNVELLQIRDMKPSRRMSFNSSQDRKLLREGEDAISKLEFARTTLATCALKTSSLLLRAAIRRLDAELALLDDLTNCDNFRYEMNEAMNLSELDYYTILNVKRSATKGEIYLAYRKLAIRLNPYRDPKHCKEFVPLAEENQLTHMSPMGLNKQWAYINMALDVLGNDLYRSIYDRYGEAGLIQGILLPNGYFPPYHYHGDHMKVYHEVFGTYSPYANIMDPITNPPPLYTNKSNGIGVRTKEPPVEKTVALSLEDVYFGCVKLMHVWRQEFIDKDELATEKRKKTLTLNIPPGITAGTRFSFKEEGDRFPTKIPSDIIFIVEDKPHDVFKRRNLYNIVYTHEISLCQALIGFRFVIETLDKRKIKVSISDVVTPDFVKILPNEGLPKYKSPDDISKSRGVPTYEYGDLIIEFKNT